MAQMDNLRSSGLKNTPHDVDRRVMPVKQARRGDEAQLVLRPVGLRVFGFAGRAVIRHGVSSHHAGHKRPNAVRFQYYSRNRPAIPWVADNTLTKAYVYVNGNYNSLLI